MVLALMLAFSALGSVGAVLLCGLLLRAPEAWRTRLVAPLVTFAAGTMLAGALLALLPRALDRAPARPVLAAVLAGIVLFFVLEKLVLWRHAHEAPTGQGGRAAPLVLLGDAIHNFVDGVVIAAAFLVSVPLGIATSLAVLAHELPQEIGDFAILLDAGYGRGRALLWNTLSAAATLPGALLGWSVLRQAEPALPYLLALASASFLYIATADLIPGLHRHRGMAATVRQLLLLCAGIGLIALVVSLHTGGVHAHH